MCVFWYGISARLSIVEVRKCCSVFFFFSPLSHQHTNPHTHLYFRVWSIHSQPLCVCVVSISRFFVNIKKMIITVIFIPKMSLFRLPLRAFALAKY